MKVILKNSAHLEEFIFRVMVLPVLGAWPVILV
jgi:hypothetical protein